MKKRFTLLSFALMALSSAHVYSQTAYRSIGSGRWTWWTSSWERTGNVFNPTPTWTVPTSAPTSNHRVQVRNGHTISLDSSRSCLNLTIDAGGRLFDNGGASALRVGVPSSGNSGTIDTATIDGTLGGTNELLGLEMGTGAASLWVRGTGTIEIGRIRPQNGNTNYPGSGANNAAPGARFLIDKDMRLNSANYAFSALNSAPTENDSVSVTIFAGRTVIVTSAAGYMHNDASDAANATAGVGGKYVYNINGTLDLTANPSITGGTKLIPFTNASSSITLNVSGLFKLGAYFKADTVSTSLGSLSLNIQNGGLVDASLTSKLIVGTVATAAATPDIFFKIAGTGALRRTTTNGVRIEFPIGTTSYTPVYITGASGPDEIFTVSIKDGLTNPAPAAATMNKEWNLVEGTPGGNTDTLRFQWTIADQGATTFSGASPVYICRWNGLSWDYTAASVSGTGTPADPYVARGTGFGSFGLFALTNSFPLPVSFINVKAFQKQTGVQVEFANASESDITNYAVEKSVDGSNFTAAGTLQPKANNGGLNAYTYFDATPNRGNNYYRIKATERNGNVKYSSTLNIRLQTTGIWVNAYPNPVRGGNVNVQLENFDKAIYKVSLFNQVGQRVYGKTINHNGGTATYTVDLPAAVKKGVYSLQVTNNVTTVNNKIVVE